MPAKKGSKKGGNKRAKKNEEVVENVDNVEQNDAIVIDSEHENDDNDVETGNDASPEEAMNDADNNNNDNNVVDEEEDGKMEEDGDDDENDNEDGNDDNNDEMDENEDDEDNNNNDENGSQEESSKRKNKIKKSGVRRKNKVRDNRYRVYLFKILQQVHPKVGITKTAMDIMNSFIEDMFEKICNEAMKLCAFNKTSTIGAREISTAVKLILPGELQKHAILEGEKAVKMFEKNVKALQARREKARGGKKGVFPGRKE